MVPLLDPNTAGVSKLNDGVMGGISNSNWQDGIFSVWCIHLLMSNI